MVKEAPTVLFLRKLLRHIRNLINPRVAFKEPEDLIQHCNEIWEDQTAEEAAAAATAAAPRPHSTFRGARHPPLSVPRERVRRRQSLAAAARQPQDRPEAAAATPFVSTTPTSVPRPRSASRAAPTRKTNRPAAGPYTAAAARFIQTCCPPSFSVPESATAMSFLPAKNLIFLQDSQNDFKFLVESGASVSILPHSSSAPPIGPHLVGANGKQIPVGGFRHRNVCFSGQNFVFDFLLAAVATPLLGMNFLARF